MSNFPTSTPGLPTNYADNVDDVMAANQNNPNGEINAIGGYIGASGDALFTGRDAKTAPVDSDVVGINDSAASNVLKKLSWVNIKATLKSYFDTLYVTTGTVVDFAGSSAPTGWLICDGATISQTTYAALFAIIGHTYGADPGGGNFILPDCQGKATVGYKSADGDFGALGNVAAGEKTHTLTSGESGVPAHTHPSTGMFVQINAGTAINVKGTGVDTYYAPATGSNTAASASAAHNNIQPSIVFNKIIKF